MKFVKTLLFLLCIVTSSLCYAEAPALVKSTAKLYVYGNNSDKTSEGYGSSTCWAIAETDKVMYFCGAGHAFMNQEEKHKKKPLYISFFYPERSSRYQVQIYKSIFENDLESLKDICLVYVNKKDVPRKYLDNITPLRLSSNYKRGERIITHGCPNGDWPSVLYGSIVDTTKNGLVIDCDVQPGRSGSAIMNEDGTRVYGILLRSSGLSLDIVRGMELLGIKVNNKE